MKQIKTHLRASSQFGRFLLKNWKYALLKPSWVKYLGKWWKTLDPYVLSHGILSVPFLTYSCIEWLESILSADKVAFEYGSGASTLYFCERIKMLVSVEHDKTWFNTLSEEMRERKVSNCELKLIEPEEIEGEVPRYSSTSYTSAYRPDLYGSLSFKRYVTSINQYQDRHFDLVFIDGRARAACIPHALPKVREEGYLVLDNADRSIYSQALKVLENYERQDFFGIGPINVTPWQTTVWKITHRDPGCLKTVLR